MAGHTLTYRGTVYPWHCDQMGHMNVMWYVGKFDEATWQLFAAAGITPSYLRTQQRGMVAVDQRLSYRGELYAGDVISVRSAIIEFRVGEIGGIALCLHPDVTQDIRRNHGSLTVRNDHDAVVLASQHMPQQRRVPRAHLRTRRAGARMFPQVIVHVERHIDHAAQVQEKAFQPVSKREKTQKKT